MRRALLFSVLLPCVLGAQAQPTLDECRELARGHYPEIRQYDLIRRTAEYDLSNARRAWLPQLSLSAQATWQTDVPGFPREMTGFLAGQGLEIPGLNRDQYKAQLELSQTIWDGGRSSADKRMAEAEAAEAARTADADLYALEGRVDGLYFGILLLDERIAQTRITIGLLRSDLDKVRSLLRNGAAAQSDADAVEAELLAAGQQLAQVEASRDSYRRMLELFIGRELGDGALRRPEASDAPVAAGPERPELRLFDARIDRISAQERLVKAATRPRFGLFVQGYYGYPGMDYFGSMMTSDWTWNALVGIRMSWNFGGYYTKRNSLGRLDAAKRQVEVQRDIFLFDNRLDAVEESGEIARLRRALADDDRIVRLRRAGYERAAAEDRRRGCRRCGTQRAGDRVAEDDLRTETYDKPMKRILFCAAAFLLAACDLGGNFDATGTFEATEVTVSAEAAGRILRFDAEEGDLLTAGEQVGEIDTVQLYLRRLQLERQRASVRSERPDIAKQAAALREQIAKQRTERRRVENLLRDGAATAKQLDDMDAQLKVLNGQLEALLSTLANSAASIDENASAIDLQIAQVEDQLRKCRIVSPVAGTVLARYAEAGELASAGRPLMKVADLGTLYLRAYFTSDQLAGLRLGEPVTVTADFGGDARYDYPGRITWIASESEFTPKTIQTRDTRANLVYAVKIAVRNDGRLKLGLYGEVRLSGDK